MDPSALPDTVSWSDEFLTGFDAIDRQHHILVDTAAQLGDGSQLDHVAARRVLRELIDYTLYHFAMEERLMKLHGYSTTDPQAFEAHLRQHQEFVAKVLAWQESHQHGEAVSMHDLKQFLIGWIRNHIQDCDRKLTGYLSSRGIKE